MSRSTRILVVDDFASMRKIVHNLLADLGFSNVVEAGSGGDAFQIARSGGLDLIITDWNMPSMTGLELLRQVRSSPRCGGVPVLMITTRAYRDEILAATDAGVSDYIIKPFTTSTLKRKIESVLGASGAAQPASNDAPTKGNRLEDAAALAEFLDEAHAWIGKMEGDLTALESGDADGPTLTRVLRGFHTLKGSAGFLGLDAIVHLCHAAEGLVGHAATAAQCQAAKATLAAIDVALNGVVSNPSLHSGGPCETDSSGPAEARANSHPMMRVDLRHIERLSSLVDALTTTCHRIAHPPVPDSADSSDLLPELNRTLAAVAGVVREIRLQPAGQLFEPLLRLTQHLAERLGKQVHVATGGDTLELDRAVADTLSVPLIQLLRNALDHGIELPDQRQRAGKSPRGNIQIDASRAEGTVTIQVSDDGAGIDPAAVRNKAAAQGLLAPEDAASISDADALALVFRPGLSMREAVTELSGRGMGLDIVKHAVEAAGGHVEIASTYGAGSSFRLYVPFSIPRADSAH